MKFSPGQRWVSDTESDLGLGLISSVDGRMVTVIFPASEEQRTYAVNNAPLSRVRLNVGEIAQSSEQWEIRIAEVKEEGGMLIYTGIRIDNGEFTRLPETRLNSFIQVADAKSRLLNGQIDTNKWFSIRLSSRNMLDRVQSTKTYGLSGARINLIPHQLYIAQEISERFAPRALLADEVGLGKTIEACLILHKQLLTGRAQRVLIIVPEPLLHQWLVELLRRFNLRFKLFDEERCASTQQLDKNVNPFDTEQLVLAPLSLFDSEQRQREALLGHWDLVIVDEAHHIRWDENTPTPQYQFVEALSKATPGLLLLTATPEQLGEDSHFARLRLLDPDRFTDFDAFMQEQLDYRAISDVVDQLISTESVPSNSTLNLVSGLLDEKIRSFNTKERLDLIRKLIDRHGPSRVLYRNTRANIQGFPGRVLHAQAMPKPEQYETARSGGSLSEYIHPELTRPRSWIHFDPRVSYLAEKLKGLANEKILVICALATTVVDLEQALRTKYGIHSAMFHENMSIVARDRAAHFFADHEGSRLLLCSEIGSEGRNFQFAHHLVLFDLPLFPDLLEQRIGRLDRIGQAQDVHIHLPYLTDDAQEVLFHWYHRGLNAFEQTCPVGQSVYEDTETELMDALTLGNASEAFIATTHLLYQQKISALEQGRDRLLEISSFDREVAIDIVRSIESIDTDLPTIDYLGEVFDLYGVTFEDKQEKTYIVHPSDHMQTAHFPFLKSDGMTVTFDRATALAHEDIEYLTWEHPMTQGAMDLVLTSDHGKAVVIGVDSDLLPRGTILVETTHVLEITAPNAPELRRFLNTTTLQFLKDEAGRDLSKLAGNSKLFRNVQNIESVVAKRLIGIKRESITAVMEENERDAKSTFADTIEHAKSALTEQTQLELQRLEYLQSINASVRSEELHLIRKQLSQSLQSFDNAQPRLDAVRLVAIL